MRKIGGCNGGLEIALPWAREIASEWSERVTLRYDGRGKVGQQMWSAFVASERDS